jgi:DNA-binding GntR family transcriptional regulator
MKKIVIEQTKTIRQKVYEHLKDAIFYGEYKPGDRLVESEIGKSIGTSRTPVREALHTLEREQLISSIPRVGYTVNEISIKDFDEMCEIRLVLEGLALRWAMEKMPQQLLSALTENIFEAEQQIDEDDIKAFIEIDTAFHDIIADLAGSEHLKELIKNIRRYVIYFRVHSIHQIANVNSIIAGHKAILVAVEKGDMEGVQVALKNHVYQSKEDIKRYQKIIKEAKTT